MAPPAGGSPPVGTSLLRQAGPLIAARLVTAVLTLSIPLVLARALSLPDFGTYKQLFLIALTLSSILPFGVAQSLYYFVPRTAERRAYFAQTLTFLLGMGAVASLLVWSLLPRVAEALGNPALGDYRLLLALFTGFTVGSSSLEVSMTSQGRTRRSAAVYLVWDTARALALVVPAATGAGLHAGMLALTALAGLRLVAAWVLTVGLTPGEIWNARLFRGQLAYALPFGLTVLMSVPQQYAHQYLVASAVGPALFAIYAAGCFDPPFVDLLYTPTGEVLMVRLGALAREGRGAESAAAFREATAHLARFLLPGIAFLWAVAPSFVVAVFGDRFAASADVFRLWLLAIPFGVFPMDATLRARNEIRFLFSAYLAKALLTVPLAYLAVSRFGIHGGAASYVAAELAGRALLASRLPRALGSATSPVRLRSLVPGRELARAAVGSLLAAAVGAGVVHLLRPLDGVAAAVPLARFVPLGVAALASAGVYLLALWLTGGRSLVALGALRATLEPTRRA